MPDPQPPAPVVPPPQQPVSRAPLVLAVTVATTGLALATQGLWLESAGALMVAVLLAELSRRGIL